MKESNDSKTVIIGGGLTGLTLGYLLSKQKKSFEILEREKECGGLMKTLFEKKFEFDIGGSHIIFSKDQEALNFILNLLGLNKVKNRRNTKIMYKKYYVKYPFENGLADLPTNENFECLKYFVQNLIEKNRNCERKKPKNLEEWCYYVFGKGIAEKYLIPYNEKIWKYPTRKTGVRWVERIPNPPFEDVLRSSLGIETEGYTHQMNFYYPKTGGIQSIIKKLENQISSNVITDFDVTKIKKEKDRWLVKCKNKEKMCDKIICTMPIQNLIKAIDAPKQIENAAKELKCNSLICVMLGLNRPKIHELSWLYIPAKDILSHRVSFPSNYSPYNAPKGTSSVLAEITCMPESKVWEMSDEALIERVIADLHSLKIINKKDVCFVKVKRNEYAYVIDDLKRDKNMQVIRKYVKDEGIDLVGRFAEFEYLNMDACVRNAINYLNNQ